MNVINAEIDDISPWFGPVAGRTNVTISGNHIGRVLSWEFVPECGQNCSEYLPIAYNDADIIRE